jgi:hypothetical protein
MAISRLTCQNIISMVRMAFPEAPENYIMFLINEAQVDASTLSVKKKRVKVDSTKNQRFYSIGDTASPRPDINKIYRVDFLNADDEYIKIPRLVDSGIKLNDDA